VMSMPMFSMRHSPLLYFSKLKLGKQVYDNQSDLSAMFLLCESGLRHPTVPCPTVRVR